MLENFHLSHVRNNLSGHSMMTPSLKTADQPTMGTVFLIAGVHGKDI